MTNSTEFRRLPINVREGIRPFLEQKPVPLGELARHLNLRVQVRPLPPGKSGRIFLSDNGKYTIEINKFEARTRQRYTLAHEIAHFLLHKEEIDRSGEISDNILYRSGIPERMEFEANRLAADLVMPSEPIEEELLRISQTSGLADDVIAKLGREWGVSSAAMEIRLGRHFAE